MTATATSGDTPAGRSDGVVSGTDFIIGTAIAIVMATAFTLLSHGASLLVTFVPGVAFAWLVFAWMYAAKTTLPDIDAFVPWFFATLAVQFLHFAEEYNTGFQRLFPELYGGAAYGNEMFVNVNMVMYAVFALSCLLVFYKRWLFLLLPMLFFIVYGAIGNAVSHSWWVAQSQTYFPGFFTSLAYWILGPLLLARLLGNWLHAVVVIVPFGALLVALLTNFSAL